MTGPEQIREILLETRNCRQIPGDPRRRWFSSRTLDLIVWYEGEVITGFQLCYRDGPLERALTWNRGRGYRHERVDDGERPMRSKMTPILVPDGPFPKNFVYEMFISQADNLESDIRETVENVLLQFPEQ